MSIIKKINLINYLIAIIPITLIIGNLATNINIILICILGLSIYGKKVFLFEDKKYLYFLYIFFIYLIITTSINNLSNFGLNPLYKENFIKSFLFLRFLLFFLIINKLIEKNCINLKPFIVFSGLSALALSIDILIQVYFGKNIFGYSIIDTQPSGFFGDELIAGGYLQKFIFFFIAITYLRYFNLVKKNLLILFLLCIFALPIFLTGNRMPFIIYSFSSVIFLLINKKYKYFLSFVFFISLIIFFSIKFPMIERIDKRIKSFFYEISLFVNHAPKLFYYDNYKSDQIHFQTGYLIHFNSGIQIWKNNKIIGNGLKSMPLKCKYENLQTCNTHPHNYFIELLMDTGSIGLTLMYFIFLFAFKNFYKIYFYNSSLKSKIIFFPFFIIIFFEFFPFRSSGSFFTTNNAVIIFLMLAIFVNCKNILKIINNYKI